MTSNNKYIYAGIVAAFMIISIARADEEGTPIQQNTPSSVVKDIDWSLRLPKEDKVEYKGVVSFDKAGEGTGTMMYPAGAGAAGAVGFLAAIVTHGLIVDNLKDHQKSKIQAQADKVLSPYHTVLDHYTYQELMQAALKLVAFPGNKELIGIAEKSNAKRTIESNPVFSLTQDQRAIIVENVISISNSDAPSNFVYQNTVRVVSPPREESGGTDFWIGNQGEKLKEESTRLLAYSFDLALNDFTSELKESHPQKTFRYFEGETEKMERGELISDMCDRIVIKTLRGWLMSIPKKPDTNSISSPTQCGDILTAK
jgi:hypothetical protein